MSSVVKLSINNREFEVACGLGQEEALVQLSHDLDRRIRHNAISLGDTNTNLLLVITALQLLDEVTDLRSGAQNAAAGGVNVNEEIGKATIATLSQISERIEVLADNILRKAS